MSSRNAWHFFVDADTELAYNNSMMNDMTEDQLMAALRELIVEGKVRSFVKEGGDPGNPDHWMYEAIEQDNS